MEVVKTNQSVPIYINFTHKAKMDLNNLLNGLTIREFLTTQNLYHIQIEKDNGRDESLYLNFYLSPLKNESVKTITDNKALVFSTVMKEDGFLVMASRVVPKHFGDDNIRRISQEVHFFIDEKSSFTLDQNLHQKIEALPVAREQSKIVKERLRSWEVYLDLMLEKAESNQADLVFHGLSISSNLREITLNIHNLQEQVAGKKLRSANATFYTKESEESSREIEEQVGMVKRIDLFKNRITIELDEDYVDLLRRNRWVPKKIGTVKLNNYGDLSQARHLRNGFKNLQNGKSLNPNLEYLLFEEDPISDTSSLKQEFEFDNVLQSNLNTYQKDAVKGALEASDLYLIQGPPGTGKTTVIAEICYQNAIQGLKTLVASQSNLAVDNALSKLLEDPKIRILRKGRTNSIEEEGKKFIEENVAFTWRDQTQSSVKKDIYTLEKILIEKRTKENQYKQTIEENKNYISKTFDFSSLQKKSDEMLETMQDYRNQISDNQKRSKILQTNITQHEKTLKDIERKIKNDETRLTDLSNQASQENKQNFLFEQKQAITNAITYKNNTERFNELKELLKSYTEKIEKILVKKEETENRFNKYDSENHLSYQHIDGKSTRVIELEKEIKRINSEKSELQTSSYASDLHLKQFIEPIEKILNRQEILLRDIAYDITTAKELLQPTQEVLKVDYINRLLETSSSRIINVPKLPPIKKIWIKVSGKYAEHYDVIVEDYTKLIKISKRLQDDVAKNEQIKKWSEKLDQLKTEHKKMVKAHYENAVSLLDDELTISLKLRSEHEREFRRLKELTVVVLSSNSNLYMSYPLRELIFENERCDRELEEIEKIEETKRNLYTSNEQLKIEFQTTHVYLKNDLADFEKVRQVIQQLSQQVENVMQSRGEVKEKIDKLEKFLSHKTPEGIEKENRKLQRLIRTNTISIKEDEVLLRQKKIWSDMLEDAKEHDLEEIRKMYIKHANVIGTTCVQSARRDFVEEYPDFDVVIIDEVSKATPPELLLPMLKGKKIILVGDHHQLPPLVGQETLEEVASKEETIEQRESLKNTLKESLFERLFNSLDNRHKQTLRIQYRMHETIMNTISQFYEGSTKESVFGLSCGLVDSDAERDHFLEGNIVKRGQHLMWFDLPNEPEFFEKSEQGSTSKYNEAELHLIQGIIEDLELATANAKANGFIGLEEKKQVGIISFYGDQIQKIKNLVDDEIQTEHLTFRIGTVDRFQGMESDIIIASFVRNHQNPQDDIGFLNEYRRLNVALSRAKELLIITGSSAMFTRRAKNGRTRTRFKNVLHVVKEHNGLRDHMGRNK
ncbi:AAA domain-containing protein [Exiguobacterium sp. SH3S1]|uniref:AAA domain-containing protein n=1 Tax=Exiguobacterium sp. SH3S1 TaxID=2510955 RepID=UPI0010396680|nr:AAA domain-containing protein [Exiguobacterium sp. SH3S1]TCI60811.1 hypothetical protein EVJ26_11095 [Exiguobacterium sp. SH3S1]